ncbi:MAG: hypothetical protein AB7N70_08550 [Dehalococcoidia bacterium]
MAVRFASIGAAFLLLIVAGSTSLASASGQATQWSVGGAGLTDDGGRLYISEQLDENLLADGLTYVRVTSGHCNGSAEDYVVYEATLGPEGQNGQVYVAQLEPIGLRATPLHEPNGVYNVFLFGRDEYSGFTVAIDGLTPDITFTACFRAP